MDLSQEKGLWPDWRHCPLTNMGFLFISLHSGMLSLSLRYNWPFENSPSHWSCGHPFTVEHTVMSNWRISLKKTWWLERQLHCCQKCVMESQQNFTCNLYQESPCPTIQLSQTMVLARISLYMVSGEADLKNLLDVRVFNPWDWMN